MIRIRISNVGIRNLVFALGLLTLVFTLCPAGGLAQPKPKLTDIIQDTPKDEAEGNKENDQKKSSPPVPLGPADEYNRGVPRTSVMGFLEAARKGDYKRATEYMDLRYLRKDLSRQEAPELARKLRIIIDRAMWVYPDLLSDHPNGHREDGLPSYRDLLGRIDTDKGPLDLLIQRVPRGDGVYIWKISNATVKKIPELYEIYGYGRIGDYLSKKFPDFEILGLQLWQWFAMVGLLIYSFIIAFLPLWIIAIIVRRKRTELRNRVAKLLLGPVWVLLAILINRANFDLVSPTMAYRAIMEAYTGPIIVGMWVFLRLTDLMSEVMRERFERQDRQEATVLLRPAATATKILGIMIAMMFWLDNMGFRVSTILASLGVGGLAFALAAQDTLKNFIGSVIILLDKPFSIGQRIVAKGHDGIVEAIGFRSTKLRLLTGHQAVIPNETMARENIENIGRRPHIRRLTNIHLAYDTPLEKVRKAVDIIQGVLDDHEGMEPEFPPRVYFNEFNRDSLNITIFYWYHPADYWAYCAFSEKVNVQIMEAFEKEGIKFALPTSTTYLAGVDEKLPEMISSKESGKKMS